MFPDRSSALAFILPSQQEPLLYHFTNIFPIGLKAVMSQSLSLKLLSLGDNCLVILDKSNSVYDNGGSKYYRLFHMMSFIGVTERPWTRSIYKRDTRWARN